MNNLNYIYKVSDKVILPIELNRAHVVGYGVGEFDLIDEDIEKDESVWTIFYNDIPAILVSNDETFFEKGTYFLKLSDEMYMSELTYTSVGATITFTINDIEYQALKGMTWEDWFNMNGGQVEFEDSYLYYDEGDGYIKEGTWNFLRYENGTDNFDAVKPSDLIIENHDYYVYNVPS